MTMNKRLLRQVGHVLQGKLAPVARSITLSREPRNRRKQTQSIEILLNDDSISAFVKNEPKFQKTLLSLCYGCVCVILIMQDMCDDAYSAPRVSVSPVEQHRAPIPLPFATPPVAV
jgi:hypothetical protein